MTFEELVDEAAAAPVDGWDFDWLDGRATEQRPSWGYTRVVADRMPGAGAVLDLQTGGGEVFAEIIGRATSVPPVLAATEGWPRNFDIATERLRPWGVDVRQVEPHDDLPFGAESFDLVISRHPISVPWQAVATVLKPGGTYLSQGSAPGTNRELTRLFLGDAPSGRRESTWQEAGDEARAAGLDVLDLRHEELRVEFFDIGAVVYFLRKVVWTVRDFSVQRYRDELRAVHERIQAEGPLVSYSRRYLIEARKPLR